MQKYVTECNGKLLAWLEEETQFCRLPTGFGLHSFTIHENTAHPACILQYRACSCNVENPLWAVVEPPRRAQYLLQVPNR